MDLKSYVSQISSHHPLESNSYLLNCMYLCTYSHLPQFPLTRLLALYTFLLLALWSTSNSSLATEHLTGDLLGLLGFTRWCTGLWLMGYWVTYH